MSMVADPSKAHLELLEALGHAVPRTLDIPRARRVYVNRNLRMDEVEMIGSHHPQAVLHPVADVVGGVDVLAAHGAAGDAPALGGQHVLGAAV